MIHFSKLALLLSIAPSCNPLRRVNSSFILQIPEHLGCAGYHLDTEDTEGSVAPGLLEVTFKGKKEANVHQVAHAQKTTVNRVGQDKAEQGREWSGTLTLGGLF